MTVLLPLGEAPDQQGYVDYLINVDRDYFIRLAGVNTDECIGILHGFLCKYEVCGRADRLKHEVRPIGYAQEYLIERAKYADLSFVANFYRLAWRSQQRYLQIMGTRESPQPEVTSAGLPEVALHPTKLPEEPSVNLSASSIGLAHYPTPELLQATRGSLRVVNQEMSDLIGQHRLDQMIAGIIGAVVLEDDEDTDYYRDSPDDLDLNRSGRITEILSDASYSGHQTEEMSIELSDQYSDLSDEINLSESSEAIVEADNLDRLSARSSSRTGSAVSSNKSDRSRQSISIVDSEASDVSEQEASDVSEQEVSEVSGQEVSDLSEQEVSEVSEQEEVPEVVIAPSNKSSLKKQAKPSRRAKTVVVEESSSQADESEQSDSEEPVIVVPVAPKKKASPAKKVAPAKKATPAKKVTPTKKVIVSPAKAAPVKKPIKKTKRSSK